MDWKNQKLKKEMDFLMMPRSLDSENDVDVIMNT